jgi:hypothetical protein
MSWQEQWNWHCDRHGKEVLKTVTMKSMEMPAPPLSSAKMHLKINGVLITLDLRRQTQSDHTSQGCRVHVKKQFEWTDDQCGAIQWNATAPALKHFSDPDSTGLRKFLHDKLLSTSSSTHRIRMPKITGTSTSAHTGCTLDSQQAPEGSGCLPSTGGLGRASQCIVPELWSFC